MTTYQLALPADTGYDYPSLVIPTDAVVTESTVVPLYIDGVDGRTTGTGVVRSDGTAIMYVYDYEIAAVVEADTITAARADLTGFYITLASGWRPTMAPAPVW